MDHRDTRLLLKGADLAPFGLRARLQARQTRSAKRRLKKLAGKERRFAKHVNHVISKQIVAVAERTGARDRRRGIDGDTRTDKGYTAATGSSAQLGLRSVAGVPGIQGEAGGCPPGRRGSPEQQPGVFRLRTHRQTQPAQPIDLPLRRLRFRGARGYQRCQGDLWQGHCKRAERSRLCCRLAWLSYKAAGFSRAVALPVSNSR